MRGLIEAPEALQSYEKGDLLTGEELSAYLERRGLQAEMEPYSAANTLRIDRDARYTERYRLGRFACGVRWQRVS